MIEMNAGKETAIDICETSPYLYALKSIYHIIFMIDLQSGTVQCIYDRDSSCIGKMYGVQITLKSAEIYWIDNYVIPEDRPKMRVFLEHQLNLPLPSPDPAADQIEFRVVQDDGLIRPFGGCFMYITPEVRLMGLRDLKIPPAGSYSSRQLTATRKLYSLVGNVLKTRNNASFSAVIEHKDDRCFFIYADDGTLQFLGKSYETILDYEETGLSWNAFVDMLRQKGLLNFEELFNGKRIKYKPRGTGHGEYTISCRQILPDIYAITASDNPPVCSAGIPQTGIFARCFGHFDLFKDGAPVIFTGNKEKELMALLIDRNGGTLTSAEAISYLWETSEPDARLKAHYRKVAMGLKNTLRQYGIEDILISHNGIRSIDTSAMTCDYYELLAGNTQYVHSFHNCYMTDYSWAEETLGTLWDYS